MRQIGGGYARQKPKMKCHVHNLPQKHLYYTTLLTKEKQFFCKRVRLEAISTLGQSTRYQKRAQIMHELFGKQALLADANPHRFPTDRTTGAIPRNLYRL